MLHLAAFSALLINSAFAAPLDSCDDQSECLKTTVDQVGTSDEYEICLYWDDTLANCDKDGAISHACPSGEEEDKVEGFNSGYENRMCQFIDCGDKAVFGLKDGKGCFGDSDSYSFSGIEGIYCKAGTEGGYCGGGNKGDCAWVIPAPPCNNNEPEPTTTTAEPYVPQDTTTTTDCTNDAVCDDYEGCMFILGCVFSADGMQCVPGEGQCDLPQDKCNAACGCQYGVYGGMDMCIPLEGAEAKAMRVDVYSGSNTAVSESEAAATAEEGSAALYAVVGVLVGIALLVVVGAVGWYMYKRRAGHAKVSVDEDVDDRRQMETHISVTNE